MNILYCGDQGISRGVLVSILSLLKYNKESLDIYILTIRYEKTKPFTDKSTKFLDELVKKTNPKSFVKKIDATEVFVKNLPKKNMGSYFTPCSMLRLYADKVPEIAKLDRVLYLDYDVVCRKDLKGFYNTDLNGVEAAGVLDIYGKNFYHYNFPKTDYMNSGVMLFNMDECKKTKLFEKCRVSTSDFASYLKGAAGREKFNIIFLDPPYNTTLLRDALVGIKNADILAAGGIIVAESDTGFRGKPSKKKKDELLSTDAVTDDVFSGDADAAALYSVEKTKIYGRTRVTILTSKEGEKDE